MWKKKSNVGLPEEKVVLTVKAKLRTWCRWTKLHRHGLRCSSRPVPAAETWALRLISSSWSWAPSIQDKRTTSCACNCRRWSVQNAACWSQILHSIIQIYDAFYCLFSNLVGGIDFLLTSAKYIYFDPSHQEEDL